jgi:hypothetical protein
MVTGMDEGADPATDQGAEEQGHAGIVAMSLQEILFSDVQQFYADTLAPRAAAIEEARSLTQLPGRSAHALAALIIITQALLT